MHSLQIRYLSKLISNGFGAIFTFVSISFLTRLLGPSDFGLFQFLKIIFEKIFQFLLIGISGLFPKLSQKPDNKNLIIFSSLYFLATVFCVITFLILIFSLGVNDKLFSSASLKTSYLALFLVIFLTFIEETRKIMDAWKLTVKSEILILISKFLLSLLIIFIFINELRSLNLYLFLHNFLLIILSLFFIRIVLKRLKLNKSKNNFKETAVELKNFAIPLFFANTLSIFATIIERWMLQFFSGSIEQAYFSIGYQFIFFIILFTGAFTPLLLREYAVAYEKNDMQKLKELFMQFMPLFYFISSVLACFLAVNANIATFIIGGNEFREATIVVGILIMSSIHQTYGQLGGVLLLATDKSKEYAIVNSSILPLSIALSYFFIAPEHLYGLSLGALGLALSILISQIIYTNLLLVINSKYLNINLPKIIIHQIFVLFFPFILALLLKFIVINYFNDNFLYFLLTGILYLIVIVIVLYQFPIILFSTKNEIIYNIKRLLKFA